MKIFKIKGKLASNSRNTDEVPLKRSKALAVLEKRAISVCYITINIFFWDLFLTATSRHKKGQKSLLYLRKQVFLAPFSLSLYWEQISWDQLLAGQMPSVE